MSPMFRLVLLGLNAAQRVGALRQGLFRRTPAGVVDAERVAEVGPGESLDQSDSSGVLVRRLPDLVAGDPAERVLRPEESEQALAAGAQEVRLGHPVRPANG